MNSEPLHLVWFAGGGGSSCGAKAHLGRDVDYALNHDAVALRMHEVNHPGTIHMCADAFAAEPEELEHGRPIGTMWFSPDCTHHSVARGSAPKSERIRGLCWCILPWARRSAEAGGPPAVIFIENVAEFRDYGPLYPDDHAQAGKADPEHKGESFAEFNRQLQDAGYVGEWRELTVANYSSPVLSPDGGETTRKRLFGIFRCDGLPIVWPAQTNDPRAEAKAKGMKPWALAWLYGSGFPKSHDMAKAIDRERGLCGLTAAEGSAVRRIRPGADQDKGGSWEKLDDRLYQPGAYMPACAEAGAWQGWGTALKPALEPLLLARKPVDGTVAGNLQAFGTGALNIDGCRIEGEKTAAPVGKFRGSAVGATGLRGVRDGASDNLGRWPANVLHDGSDEVLSCFPDAPGQQRAVTGEERSHRSKNAYGDFGASRGGCDPRGDVGTAARFFYSAKADADDRLGSEHPTVKPVDLMAWLVRLVTPGGGLVLDPFAGSGTTGMACLREGFRAILIEREREYVDDIKRRIAHVSGEDAPLFAGLSE